MNRSTNMNPEDKQPCYCQQFWIQKARKKDNLRVQGLLFCSNILDGFSVAQDRSIDHV
ncbi:hypothetical protein OIU77_009667 [Salix suchowensis]|uniref:Uncharacterized protein n=1 Tax=Salix suchowensis TaxID=1278906 RepID=A0ABQ9AEZ8_9ROSI|nr:hypothetical protein OIU77_009667 [Salix suchowensis]